MVSDMISDDRTIKVLTNENQQLQQRLKEMEAILQMKDAELAAARIESKASLEQLAEMLPAAIHVLEGDKFSYINTSFSEITGYSKEECLNMNYWETIDPEYQDMVRQHVLERRRNEHLPNSRYELKVIAKDGGILWFDHSACQIKLAGQTAIIAVLYDITERKAAEEKILQQHASLQETHAELEEINYELQSSQSSLMEINNKLRQSENRYRTLVEAVPEIVAHININGDFMWVNDMGKEFFGQEVCGRHLSEFFFDSEDYQQAALKVIPLVKDYEGIIQVETLMKRKDGQLRLLKWQSKTLKENSKTIGTISTAQDITEIREAEIQLKASEQRYRDLFEKSPIGLIKVDREGNILDLNQYYLDIIEPPSKEALTSKNLYTIAQNIPEFAAAFNEHLHRYLSGQSISTEIHFTTSWGKKVWIRYIIDPIFDQDGNVVEAIVACEEISAWKQAQEKIKYLSYNDALTGVYNRAFFDEELRRINVTRQLPLSIIIGDVNGLKLVNDAFGHHTGDKLLITITRILKSCFREEDIIARWGGDEFAILLPRTPQATAYAICERINLACREHGPNPILPSIALGVATKENIHEDIDKVMLAAEDVMYRNKLLESKSIRNSMISSLETSLHEKTFETREHAYRIQNLGLQFGKSLGLPENELDSLALLANLHDIGKIGIPDNILCKPGPLSAEEWEIIKKHPEIGYRILYSCHELLAIANEVLAHHEKWDGSGYPERLKGSDIPILSRILAIVDAYDVMTHEQSYKKAISHAEALEEIRNCAGSHFDPELVKVFLSIFTETTFAS